MFGRMRAVKIINRFLLTCSIVLIIWAIFFAMPMFSEVVSAAEREVMPTHLGTNKVAPELVTKTETKGPVHVLVKLNVDFKPGGLINEPQQVMRQRGKIGSTQRRVQQKVLQKDSQSVKQFEYIPYLALTASKETLVNLISSDEVVSIQEDVPIPPDLAESVPLINADDSWVAGYTGLGQTVAILDTGVDYNHTFLTGKKVSEGCYSNFYSTDTSVCPNGLTVDTSAGSGLHCNLGTVGCDHGTHVAGIAVGKGSSFSGVAKDANLIAIQVFTKFTNPTCSSYGLYSPCALTYTADRILALERVYSLRTTYNIAAVNMSLGGGIYGSHCDSDAQKPAIDNLRTAGIATVIASGNDGSSTGISSPACISSAISVGSSTKLDAVSSFSNSASILDVLAPGSSINSAIAQGTFAAWSGTSMATPHVAGAWAVLKSRFPSASVSTILSALVDTGTPILDARNSLTHSRIDVNAALGALKGPSKTWYLAEGLVNDTVSTYILVQNPNGTVANFTVTYMIEGGANVVANHAVQANKRYTIGAVNDVGFNKSFSTKIVSDQEVIVERAMYFPQGGHDSIGVTVPSQTWYLAEGLSNSTVSTYILVQNPNDTVANLTVTYMIEGGTNVVASHAVQANKRYTIGAVGDIGLNKSFSTKITSTQPVAVERAMYFPQGGHVSIGVAE